VSISFIVQIILLIFLVASSAFFSGSETALFSLSASQMQSLRNAGGCRARLVLLLKKPAQVLSTLLIGNTIVNVLVAALGYSIIETIIEKYFQSVLEFSATISVAVITILLLLFGEIAPKRIAIRKPERFTSFVACPLYVCYIVFTPFRIFLEAFSTSIRRFLTPERNTLNDEELLTALNVSAEQGTLDSYELNMVDGIMQLSSMTASDVMTPRVDFVGIDLDEPKESYLALVRSQEYHFLPVYENTPDEIEGFLDVRAYLLDPEHDFDKALRKPVFVPETATLDDILITMQRSRRHIVCVMDEYGGTAGLVTRGDVLTVLTGDIPEDSSEEPSEDIVKKENEDNVWIIDGDTSLEEVNHALDLELDTEGVDRISGWVIAQAGRFLRAGESVEAQGCRVKVLKHKKLRILSVELEKLIEDKEEEVSND
jgi:putative hemolysin